jgi:transcriptional regulator with XRE-family HTH domain
MGDFARRFGARMRAARQRRGWTQAVLAEAAEVGANYVPRLERGELTPSVEAAWRLARTLGVTVDSLCADADEASGDDAQPALDLVRHLGDEDVALLRHAVDMVHRLRDSLRERHPASGRYRAHERTNEVVALPTSLASGTLGSGEKSGNS